MSDKKMVRNKYIIKGQVQGVGFRPFVHKLAIKYNLKGFIKNDASGVKIEIEGNYTDITSFETSLKDELPPLARIDQIDKKIIKFLHTKEFKIVNSKLDVLNTKTVSIPPDITICQDCLVDKYFATNCTNCGPRYSIIQTVPYDRVNTSMKNFKLCKSCQKEYENPLNRRYHAQPISCKNCGPQLSIFDKKTKLNVSDIELFKQVANFIKQGKIGAIKGIGGFHIICDATNTKTIQALRNFKNRPTKPFAIMCKDIEQLNTLAIFNTKEEELLVSKQTPIVVLKKKENTNISDLIAPNICRIGCMLPYTGFHHLLFEYLDTPIVATSANLNGEPIITTKEDIEKKLPFLDFIVDFNRDIVNAIDDSVVQVIANNISILRVARGYAPQEIKLPFKLDKKILAVGANQKNSIALAFDDKIIVSPYIGDLNSLKSFEFFKQTIKTFENFYDFSADLIIHDKHPKYETTKWAKEQRKELFEVQHHLAHIYSVKAEFGLTKDYLGFSFDGTGYGDDKKLWGGEVFIGDRRKYHFKPIKLLGGEKAIKEPRRVALSLLFETYTLDELLPLDLEVVKQFKEDELNLLYQSWSKNINCPPSSSVGRLFDAVSSLSNICHFQYFEGEAGLLCEMAYDKECKESFKYTLIDNIIDINFDFKDKLIVTKFINTLVEIILNIAKKEKLDLILSGGVFQNKILLELICNRLIKQNIKYFYNQTTSINDGGIALGQIYYYLMKNRIK